MASGQALTVNSAITRNTLKRRSFDRTPRLYPPFFAEPFGIGEKSPFHQQLPSGARSDRVVGEIACSTVGLFRLADSVGGLRYCVVNTTPAKLTSRAATAKPRVLESELAG